MTVTEARETVDSQVVQQTRIQCFNCKEFGHFAKECRKPKRVKNSTYHKEKMLLCKQAEKGVPLQAEQSDWLEDTVQYDAKYNEFANERQHFEQPGIQTISSKEIDIKEGLKLKAYEISVVKEKHDELVKHSLFIKSHYEGLVKGKTKVITDLKSKEEKDINKMISMEKQLKFLNEIVYKRNQSIQTIHMLAPKGSTFNGRPTFANPMYLKKAQTEKPRLYEIPYDTSDLANRFTPDREETLTLEKQSRSKLDKDLVKPYDYIKQNSLYEIFKPTSKEYHDQLAHVNEVRKKMWRKSFVKTKPKIFKNIGFLPNSKSTSKSRQAYNVMTNNINHFRELVDQAWEKHSHDHFRTPTAHDMEILIKTCLMPLALKTQNESFTFVHELKQEMHADLKYVESFEKEIDELESDKAEFSNMYDLLLQECVSKDIMCSYLHSLSDLDAHTELQCLYLHKVKECEYVENQKTPKKDKSVTKHMRRYLHKVLIRSEKVYNYILHQRHDTTMRFSIPTDNDGNNILRITLGWTFDTYSQTQCRFRCSSSNAKTNSMPLPVQLFKCKESYGGLRREHKKLRKDREEWMKNTADSYTITVALIITIVFVAAINVLGGNDDKTGKPILRRNRALSYLSLQMQSHCSQPPLPWVNLGGFLGFTGT
ncbi:retrovirus-related pol polyprotein from transposon TNT 1-94 [Tanacetum coccineum]